MRLLLTAIFLMLPVAIFADQSKAVYADEAAANGFTLKKSELNLGVIQVVATLPQGTTSVGLIIRGSDDQFISSSALEIKDNRCSAILAQAAIGNSSFVTPYVAKSEDETTELYFGKTKAEQGSAHQSTTRPESKSE
ncbi:hypothetical protein JIN85_20310 [Luteolibacter pohnpeiensis]|uniref:Uncharacterized protein n=1 Tax=Luteolibacter pohnpeiensis TaxID=454153 RepID=A0A934VWM5_9BACT|nr:hypothetical protein [Luteolibacter pohnpeiensis]MBK1884767.1 hypothetical protein [Luteolibacter pohnpeiensis]